MAKLVAKNREQAEPEFLPHVRRIADAASDFKALKIKALDVRKVTLIADAFVLCSARSEPQMKAISNGIREAMQAIGMPPLATEGDAGSGWLVMDYSTVIVHIFREESREFYDLDGLWADAPHIALELEE